MGLWLMISPWVFRHYPDERGLWLNDLVCGGVIVIIACSSFWRPLRYSHLLLLVVGAWLVGFGYFRGGHPALPGYQNEIFIGLTLLFFAFIPTRVTEPPADWKRFYSARSGPS